MSDLSARVPRTDRLVVVSAADVLTPTEAAERLGGRRSVAVEWLEDRELVRDVPGLGRRVVWGDVLDEIRLAGDRPPEQPAPRARLARAGITPRRR